MAQFTADTARSNALKSVEARRRHAAEREAAAAQAPEPPLQAPLNSAPDRFMLRRLDRVRGQLERLDDMIEKETDPAKLDRLASALSRLSEQERQYAGRPLPGSYRPTESRSRRPGLFCSPSEIEASTSSAPAINGNGADVMHGGQEQE